MPCLIHSKSKFNGPVPDTNARGPAVPQAEWRVGVRSVRNKGLRRQRGRSAPHLVILDETVAQRVRSSRDTVMHEIAKLLHKSRPDKNETAWFEAAIVDLTQAEIALLLDCTRYANMARKPRANAARCCCSSGPSSSWSSARVSGRNGAIMQSTRLTCCIGKTVEDAQDIAVKQWRKANPGIERVVVDQPGTA
jgi:hypothetical protein